MNLISLCITGRLDSRWRAEVRSVRFIGGNILQHGIKRRSQRRESGETRENRAVANVAVDDKRRTLCDLKGMKFRRAGTGSSFNLGRTGAFDQLRLVETSSPGSDFSSDFPLTGRSSLAERRVGQRESNTIIGHAQISRSLRD